MSLRLLFDRLGFSLDLSTPQEVVEVCHLICAAETLTSGARDTLILLYKQGPLADGNLPSAEGCEALIAEGFAVRIVYKGVQGWNACTQRGARAYTVLYGAFVGRGVAGGPPLADMSAIHGPTMPRVLQEEPCR